MPRKTTIYLTDAEGSYYRLGTVTAAEVVSRGFVSLRRPKRQLA